MDLKERISDCKGLQISSPGLFLDALQEARTDREGLYRLISLSTATKLKMRMQVSRMLGALKHAARSFVSPVQEPQ